MEPVGLITLDMIQPRDVLVIDGQERFARAIYLSTANLYRWVDVVLDGGTGEEALEFALLDGGTRWYVVHFTEKLSPQDLSLRRGQRLPDYITYNGQEYMLQSDGSSTTERVDQQEEELYSHFADYVNGTDHLGITVYDVSESVYAGEIEIWHGHEVKFDDIQILPIDTEHNRQGVLTRQVYRSLPDHQSKHWWQR